MATPATLGHYICLSTENGYQQTMAIYHIKQKTNPLAEAPTSYTWNEIYQTTQAVGRARSGLHTSTGTESKLGDTKPTLSIMDAKVTTKQLGRNLTLWKEESGHREAEFRDGEHVNVARSHCYIKELIVVSVLLVLCLSLLIIMLLYIIRQHFLRRTAPHVAIPARNSDKRTSLEQEAPRGNTFLIKSNGKALHRHGFVCNGTLTGSNGNLANTPI